MPYIEPQELRPEQPLRPEKTGPIAWEDASLSWSRRLLATLSATFSPVRTLHAVANGRVAPALGFALVSAVPFMMLWAIIPFTHQLVFHPSFGLEVKQGASVALDVARAVAIGVAFGTLSTLSWGLPFTSLLRAFAASARADAARVAAIRTVLYRAWVLPCGFALFYVVLWSQPADPNDFLIELSLLAFRMLPRLLVLVHCHAVARYFGITGLSAMAVSLVPWAVEWAVELSVPYLVQPLLPTMPPAEKAPS